MNKLKTLVDLLHPHRKKFGYAGFVFALLSMLMQRNFQELGAFRVFIGGLLSAGFFLSASLYFYFGFVYTLKPDAKALAASESEAGRVFWNEAKKRRRIALWMWPCWFIAAPVLMWVYSNIWFSANPMAHGFAALATYMVLLFGLSLRFTNMKCFHCGEKAFSNLSVFRKQCQSCGTPFKPVEKVDR